MTKKNWVLILVALVLAAIYVVYFTDWFRPKIIVIHHVNRETRAERRFAAATHPDVMPVTFGLEKATKLTEVKVVNLSIWQTNHACISLWHLTTSSNSVPLKMFEYGQRIRGLEPAVAGTSADELQPGVVYRLFLKAESASGQHDFTPIAP